MNNFWVDEKSDKNAKIRDEIRAELEVEYKAKLESLQEKHTLEMRETKNAAEEGYKQSYGIITDLQERLQNQKEEYDKRLEEGFEEAHQALTIERKSKQTLEVTLYEEYDKKLKDCKDFMVDKVDQFLRHKWKEIQETAPTEIQQKFNEWRAFFSPTEMVDMALDLKPVNQIEDYKSQIKILEARVMRLTVESHKLQEENRSIRAFSDKIPEDVRKENEELRTTLRHVKNDCEAMSKTLEVVSTSLASISEIKYPILPAWVTQKKKIDVDEMTKKAQEIAKKQVPEMLSQILSADCQSVETWPVIVPETK